MEAFPAYFPLKGAKIVIAGTGEAAEAKARLFDGSPAHVVRIEAPEAFTRTPYLEATLVFIAGDNLFAETAHEAAKAAGAMINVVDKPRLSDFQTPAVIDRGEVVAAVGTAGAAPLLSSLLRSDIEARVPEGAGRVAALLHKHQIEVRKALPDQAKRRFFMREVLNGPIAQLAMDGDMDAAGEQLVEALAQGGKVRGRVRYIAGRGPADLLTLRAARTLAAADILIADDDADPQILSLARRDAERIDPAEIDVKGLIAHADTGLQVARVITGPVNPADLRALMKAKVEVEVLLAAPSA